jgi:hypothetical protein
MSEALQSWIDHAAAVPGVLACGARCADHSILARSSYDEFSAAKIEEILREIADVLRTLEQNRIAAHRLRWTFEIGSLYGLVLADGALVALLAGKHLAGSPELERLLADFSG